MMAPSQTSPARFPCTPATCLLVSAFCVAFLFLRSGPSHHAHIEATTQLPNHPVNIQSYHHGSHVTHHGSAGMAAQLAQGDVEAPGLVTKKDDDDHAIGGARKQQDAMKAAEQFLSPLGIPRGLPVLHVHFGATTVHAGDQFNKKVDRFLQAPPTVTWSADLGPCTLVLIDPDAPTPAGDSSLPGKNGPWLHWLVTDAVGKASNGQEEVDFMGPTPPQGNHRYIFLLFQQPNKVRLINNDRARWDIKGFLKANPSLKAVAATFLYTSA